MSSYCPALLPLAEASGSSTGAGRRTLVRARKQVLHPVLLTVVVTPLARCRSEPTDHRLHGPTKRSIYANNNGTVGVDIACGTESFDGSDHR